MTSETQNALYDLTEEISWQKLLIEERGHGAATVDPGGQSTTTAFADPSGRREMVSPETGATLA